MWIFGPTRDRECLDEEGVGALEEASMWLEAATIEDSIAEIVAEQRICHPCDKGDGREVIARGGVIDEISDPRDRPFSGPARGLGVVPVGGGVVVVDEDAITEESRPDV